MTLGVVVLLVGGIALLWAIKLSNFLKKAEEADKNKK